MSEKKNAPQEETKGSIQSKQDQVYTESYVLPLAILAMTAVMTLDAIVHGNGIFAGWF